MEGAFLSAEMRGAATLMRGSAAVARETHRKRGSVRSKNQDVGIDSVKVSKMPRFGKGSYPGPIA